MAQYDERVELNIGDELAKGQRIIEMRELFSQEIVEAGDAAYQRFELRYTGAKIALVLIVAIIIIGCVSFVAGRRKSRQRLKTNWKPPDL